MYNQTPFFDTISREGGLFTDIYDYFSRLLRLLIFIAAVLLMIWGPQPAAPAEPLAAAAGGSGVRTEEAGTFARVTVMSEHGVSLEQALVLVNGEPVGSLAGGRLPVRVYDGDRLAVDARSYGRELTFYLVGLSADVDPAYLQLKVTCKDELAPLGFVVIREL